MNIVDGTVKDELKYILESIFIDSLNNEQFFEYSSEGKVSNLEFFHNKSNIAIALNIYKEQCSEMLTEGITDMFKNKAMAVLIAKLKMTDEMVLYLNQQANSPKLTPEQRSEYMHKIEEIKTKRQEMLQMIKEGKNFLFIVKSYLSILTSSTFKIGLVSTGLAFRGGLIATALGAIGKGVVSHIHEGGNIAGSAGFALQAVAGSTFMQVVVIISLAWSIVSLIMAFREFKHKMGMFAGKEKDISPEEKDKYQKEIVLFLNAKAKNIEAAKITAAKKAVAQMQTQEKRK